MFPIVRELKIFIIDQLLNVIKDVGKQNKIHDYSWYFFILLANFLWKEIATAVAQTTAPRPGNMK